jgi:hypothetical protein
MKVPRCRTGHSHSRDQRHPVQVEIDAVDSAATLHNQFLSALTEYWDEDIYASPLEREDRDMSTLRQLASRLDVA